jgi:hypothetical protein
VLAKSVWDRDLFAKDYQTRDIRYLLFALAQDMQKVILQALPECFFLDWLFAIEFLQKI